MRKYEFVSIFKTKEDNYGKGLEAVKALLTEAGAEILKEEDMKDRQLAYPIKKEDRGHYHFFLINLDGSKIAEIEESLKLREELLKHLFVRTEE